jgi:hypothetical protein
VNPATKRFDKRYSPIYDTIAQLDIAQSERETIAEALGDALVGQPDFRRDIFVLMAKDPLGPCAGPGDEPYSQPCLHGRMMRTYHSQVHPDCRRPLRWCISCGAHRFVGVPLDQVA